MRHYQITTDSNSDLPNSFIKQYNIPIIPQYYVINDIVYGDELHLSTSEFYSKMREGVLPGSMANNPEVIRDVFENILQQGKDILHIAFSSALSGSYNNVCMIANELSEKYPDSTINIIDSLNVSLGEGLLVLYAYELQKQGKSLEENTELIRTMISRCHVEFTVDDLHHLQRGGRVSKTTAIVGTMISVKPILTINNEGKLVPNGTVRGRKKSLSTLVNKILETIDTAAATHTIGIVHGDCFDEAKHVADLIRDKIGPIDILINDVSPSIGSHAGPGALGVCYIGKAN